MPENLFSPRVAKLWLDYIEAEELGVKDLIKKSLSEFLAAVEREPFDARFEFTAKWCTLALDRGESPTVGNGAPTRGRLITGTSLIPRDANNPIS